MLVALVTPLPLKNAAFAVTELYKHCDHEPGLVVHHRFDAVRLHCPLPPVSDEFRCKAVVEG